MTGRNARITGGMPLWSAARFLLNKRHEEFFCHLGKALVFHGHDEIHDLRVASRRLREAARTFESCYAGAKIRKIERMARHVTVLLGELRNIDEAIIFFTKLMDKCDEASRLHIDRFIVAAGKLREKELTLLSRRLGAIASPGRKETLAASIALPRLITASSEAPDPFTPLEDFAREVMDRRIAKVLGLVAPATKETNVSEQHRLRIAVKHLRYCVELFGPLMKTRLKKVIETLKGYQTVLGNLHDMDVFREMINEAVFSRDVEERVFGMIAIKRREHFSRFENMLRELPLVKVCNEVKDVIGK